MSAEDWIPDWWPEDDGPDDPQCRYCGAHPLFWDEVRGKWRLHNPDGSPHNCRERSVAKASEFPIV